MTASKELSMKWKYLLREKQIVHENFCDKYWLSVIIIIMHAVDECMFAIYVKPVLKLLCRLNVERGIIKKLWALMQMQHPNH
jgi:hypothetical protein